MHTMLQVAARCMVLDEPRMLSAAIAKIEGTVHSFAVPLYRAALAGEFKLIALLPDGRVPARLLDHTCGPTVIMVCGDGTDPAAPPEAFPQARRLMAWAGFTMVHATGGQSFHYTAVAEAARHVRRALLIETATVQEDAWTDLLRGELDRRHEAGRRMPSLVLSARPGGGVHPVKGAGN